jgi:hypothetical protein
VNDTFWLKADNITTVMPNLGLAIRSQVAAGKVIEVAIKEAKAIKTRQQEKYAHACIGTIAKEVGESPEALKVRIKVALGLIEEFFAGGKVITQTRSTSTLTRDEYGQFIDAIQQTANHLNICLPQPKDMGFFW